VSDQLFELVWMQRLGGGCEVLRRGIPSKDALTVLQQADGEDHGPGVVVLLRPDGETRATAELAQRAETAEAEAAELLAELTQLRIRIDTQEAIIRGAGEQLGQGDIPLAVAIARLHTAHLDAWKLIGRCDMAFELVEVARSIRGARARASEMRAEIKKASGK
jgi:hypothetical protein